MWQFHIPIPKPEKKKRRHERGERRTILHLCKKYMRKLVKVVNENKTDQRINAVKPRQLMKSSGSSKLI